MKKLMLVLGAVASIGAFAADISVPANTTETISETPAEQPSSASVEGTLALTGSAVVIPSTVSLGAVSSNARIEVGGQARFGDGVLKSRTVFTVGANGGMGSFYCDGGNTDMDKAGLGLGEVVVSANATSASDTLDLLTIKSGAVRTSYLYNDNAKPVRILFAGGELRCGQGWGSELTGRGDFIWESVDGQPIRINLADYGNDVRIQTGNLAVRGSGDVEFRCSWGNSGDNGVVSIKKPIAWEGSGDVLVTANGKLNITCDDAFPYGEGKGIVRVEDSCSYIRVWYEHTQHLNSLYIPKSRGGRFIGSCKLVFGSGDQDGTLQAEFSDAMTIEKVGEGVLVVDGETMADKSVLNVREGVVRVASKIALQGYTVADGARLVVDGGEIVLPPDHTSDLDKVSFVNGGKITYSVGGESDDVMVFRKFASGSAIEKIGQGDLTIRALSMPGEIRVEQGSVAVSGNGCTDTFYRWTVRENVGAANGRSFKVGEFALFDGNGKWIDWPSPARVAASKAASDFARGEFQLLPGNVKYDWMIQDFHKALDHLMEVGNPDWNMHTDFQHAALESDSSTWEVITWRLPDGVDSLASFDVCSAAQASWQIGTPISWRLESSPDGTTWKLLHELSAEDPHGTAEHGCWMSGGVFKNDRLEPPKEMFVLGGYKSKIAVPGREAYAVRMSQGTSVEVLADSCQMNHLTVPYAGGIALKGVDFAAEGVLEVEGVPDEMLHKQLNIACVFENCENLDRLGKWQVMINGETCRSYCQAASNRQSLCVFPYGLILFVK